MLEKVTYDIELKGLSQHDDSRKTIPGTLTRADNVEVVKAGKLTIRRGYRIIQTARAKSATGTQTNVTVRTNGDQLFHRLASWREGVVVLAHARIFAVVSRLSEIDVSTGNTTGIADHGRIARSGVRSRVIFSAEITTGTGGEAAGPGA